MIIGTHTVIATRDAEADLVFFKEALGLKAIDAGGGYMIVGLPASEASLHPSDGDVPHHELYFLTDDVDAFVADMSARSIDCGPVEATSWGRVVKITLPSGAPLHIYQPRHARP